MTIKRVAGVLTLGGLLLFAPAADAYETVTVDDGGSISGTIALKGKAPAVKTFKVTKNVEACGTSKLSEELLAGKAGALKNAVVYLRDVKKGRALTASHAVLDQKKCVYGPHVQAAAKGSPLTIHNNDPVMHNVHGTMTTGRMIFNVGMPGNRDVTKKLRRPGLAIITCDAGHTWMKAYIHIFEHPYFFVTQDDGTFKLEGVPPGTYELVVWHETLGEKISTIKVSAGADTKTTIHLANR